MLLGQLGKSKLSSVQRIYFLGVELDSVCMTARLMDERAQSVLDCLSSFKGRTVVLLKQSQRLLGHMASAVTPLGLLHMRSLQHWLHSRVRRWAVRHGTLRVTITHSCRRSFNSWTDLGFLRAGVPLEYLREYTIHPSNRLFIFLSPGKRYRSMMAKRDLGGASSLRPSGS